jgi:hypothetical protein
MKKYKLWHRAQFCISYGIELMSYIFLWHTGNFLFFFREDKTKQHAGKGIPNNTEWEPSELWTGSRKSVEYPVALNVFLLIQYCSRQNSRIKSPQCQFLILTLNINLTSKRYLNIFFKGDQTMNSNTNLNSTNQK